MRRLLAPAFVTVLACGKTTPKPEVETHNPPAFDDWTFDAARLANDGAAGVSASANAPSTASANASANAPSTASASPSSTARVRGVHKKRKRTAKANFERNESNERVTLGESWSALNPKDDKGRLIQAASDDTCNVEVPASTPTPATKTGGPSGLTAREWVEVDCPAELDDPAWDHCNDRLVIDPQSRCFCVTGFGNPPPPPRLLKCPAGAAPPKKR